MKWTLVGTFVLCCCILFYFRAEAAEGRIPIAGPTTITSTGSYILTDDFPVSSGPAITIDASNDTLDKLSAYVNANNYGVQASVIDDAGGARLALLSKTSGLPGDLSAPSTAPASYSRNPLMESMPVSASMACRSAVPPTP